ncbi:hypothetical protein [Phaeobacter inhibens]|uniref:hypothetical protein n=1 Tax=Phaeobacter inhibens TaxID=221822 RepID=UPI0021A70D4D|nr:hypothetical protein [Phaeobacter inhibens]UWR95544.1 hypothetical protein K4K99_14375 [Phaeobacter inhibens]
MTIWRPAQSIRVKTIGLPWRDGRFLAAEVPDDSGRTCIARWFHPDALEAGGIELFPARLKTQLQDLGSPARA